MLESIDKKYAIKIMEEGEEFRKPIESEKQERIKETDFKFNEVIEMLVQSYNSHCMTAIPEPKSLPIKVCVQLIGKGIEFRDVIMQTYDSMNDIKRYVERKLEEKNNPIEEWCQDVEIIIKGPLANLPKAEEQKNEWDIDAGMSPDDVLGKIIKVENLLTTREKLNIENGSIIQIFGTIKLKSDLPKKCIKIDFNKDDESGINYFKCNTCKTKWI